MQSCMIEKTEYFCKDMQLDGAGHQKFGAFCLDFKKFGLVADNSKNRQFSVTIE